MTREVLALSLLAALGCDADPNKAVQAMADKSMHGITAKVAADSVAQYEIAKKSDDKIQICVQAGMVSAAYLQAKDEPNFLKWKDVEKTDCAAAGMPK